MEIFYKRAARLFDDCQMLLRQEGIPISDRVLPLKINTRAKSRFGCCKVVRQGGRTAGLSQSKFQIEISSAMADAADWDVKNVLLHELIHTCPGCMNHGKRWKLYADRINLKYGYGIKATSRYSDFGLEEPEKAEQAKYLIICKSCGMEIRRKRRSKLVENTDKYRCGKCGGALEIREIPLHLVDEKKTELW